MSGSADTVTLSRADLAQRDRLLALLDKAWADPEFGQTVHKAFKKVDPTINIPEEHPLVVDAHARIKEANDRTAALETAFNEYKTTGEKEKTEAKLRKQLSDVQDKFKFADETMAKVIETMQERQLADPEAAALIVREAIPKAPPQAAGSKMFDTKMNLFGTGKIDEDWRLLHEDQDAFFSQVVSEVDREYGGLS